ILASRLPIGTLWRASRDGLDLSPPLNTILTHAIDTTIGVGPIATRLPAIAGFLTAVVLLFIMVRRRTNPIVALAAAVASWAPAVRGGTLGGAGRRRDRRAATLGVARPRTGPARIVLVQPASYVERDLPAATGRTGHAQRGRRPDPRNRGLRNRAPMAHRTVD